MTGYGFEGDCNSFTYNVELDFTDDDCLDFEYFKSDITLEEEDKIRYSLTYEKQAPSAAVEAGAEETIFGYSFQCIMDRFETVDVDPIKIEAVTVVTPETGNVDNIIR